MNDTVHSYIYDAEGNITKVDGGSTAQYVYDVFNRRIHVQTASATTEYIYDYAGRRISSWVSPNNTGNEGRIYWDGQLVAHRSFEALTYFDHQDTLGTDRIRTNYGGWVAATYISLPWGDGYTATVNNAGADQDNEHFGGLERDAESGTEHAQFRNYASAQGRWLAPDPYMGSYNLSNPQSMNRYAYVLNNPLSLVDPTGLDCGDSNGTDIGDAGGTGIEVGGGCNPPDPPPSQPGNWCGGVAWGTEGCIQAPCGYPGAAPCSGGGGSSGTASAATSGTSSAPSSVVAKICGALPSGTVVSVSGNGNYGGTGGSLDLVTNATTGEVTGFFSPGYFAGPTTAGASLTGGYTLGNLGAGNSNFAGGFTGASVGWGIFAGSAATSSGGPASPASGISPFSAGHVTTVSAGFQTPGRGASLSTTFSLPTQLGSFWTLIDPATAALFAAHQACVLAGH